MAKKPAPAPKPPPVVTKPPPVSSVPIYLHVRDGYPETVDAMTNVPLEVS